MEQDYPEPPLTGDEADTLVGSLERQRATFAYKCADLRAEGLAVSIARSTVTLGGLLKHLAYMEDINVTRDLAGQPLPPPWRDVEEQGRADWVWQSAADDDAAELYALWEAAVARSRLAVADALARSGPAATYRVTDGTEVSLRRLLVDLIEEYGRHTGHADLIRESIDGRVGEDPPGRPWVYRAG